MLLIGRKTLYIKISLLPTDLTQPYRLAYHKICSLWDCLVKCLFMSIHWSWSTFVPIPSYFEKVRYTLFI